jgi:hypothetical protein
MPAEKLRASLRRIYTTLRCLKSKSATRMVVAPKLAAKTMVLISLEDDIVGRRGAAAASETSSRWLAPDCRNGCEEGRGVMDVPFGGETDEMENGWII